MPRTSEDLRTRFRVMASCWMMAKMRYQANPLLQSVELDHFTRYINFLFGPKGWMLVSLGPDKVPISCPTIDHVMAYDAGLRENMAKQLNNGVPFQTARGHRREQAGVQSSHGTGHRRGLPRAGPQRLEESHPRDHRRRVCWSRCSHGGCVG